MTRVLVKLAGRVKTVELELPGAVTLSQLRALVAESVGLPWQGLSIVHKGKPLESGKGGAASNLLGSRSGKDKGEGLSEDDQRPLAFSDGDTLFAMVRPPKPPSHLSRPKEQEDEEEEDDDLRFVLPQSAPKLQHGIATFLRERLHFPDWALIVFFWLSPRAWLLLLLWCAAAPLLQYYFELGPLFILGTCFALIFINLGTRQPGEASAYSIFNEGFQELPGTLNADRIDNDIRAGQF